MKFVNWDIKDDYADKVLKLFFSIETDETVMVNEIRLDNLDSEIPIQIDGVSIEEFDTIYSCKVVEMTGSERVVSYDTKRSVIQVGSGGQSIGNAIMILEDARDTGVAKRKTKIKRTKNKVTEVFFPDEK